MQKFEIKQEFDCPLQILLRAREERYENLDKFPELKNVQIISEEKNGDIIKQKRHILIAESLPPVLNTLLPDGSDTLVEKSEFDLKRNIHTFSITPGGNMDNIFSIKGISNYFSLTDSRSARQYNLEISSGAFLIGGIIEVTIAEIYRKNLEKDRISITEFIHDKDGKSNVG